MGLPDRPFLVVLPFMPLFGGDTFRPELRLGWGRDLLKQKNGQEVSYSIFYLNKRIPILV